MFDVIEHTLSAAVADNGTFTVSYPDNRSAGDYTGAHAHVLIAMQTKFLAPEQFTLTFGASNITVTYLGSTTIPTASAVILQVDRLGTDDKQPEKVVVLNKMPRSFLYPVSLGSPDAADANGFVESQDLTSAGVFSVNTTAAAAIAAGALAGTADVPRNVVAAWTTSATLTFTGTDEFDETVIEVSAAGTSHTGKKAFKTLTSVSTDVNVTSLTVGTGNVLGLPVYVESAKRVVGEFQGGVPLQKKPGVAYVTLTDALVSEVPISGRVTDITTMFQTAWTVAKTPSLGKNGSALKMGAAGSADMTITLQGATGATADIGDKVTITGALPHTLTANDVASGDYLNLILTGAMTASEKYQTIVEITALKEADEVLRLHGTFVAGVTSAATGTTGDVRGTYTPQTTPDGATAFEMLVWTADPGNRGVPQYNG